MRGRSRRGWKEQQGDALLEVEGLRTRASSADGEQMVVVPVVRAVRGAGHGAGRRPLIPCPACIAIRGSTASRG